jgi:AraC-like DNA-binding protein
MSASSKPYHIRLAQGGAVRCEPAWSWHPRASNFRDFDLWYVWTGLGQIRHKHKTYQIVPGAAFCLRPHQTYDAVHDPNNRLGVCYLHFSFIGKPPRDLPPFRVVLEEVGYFETVLRRAVDLNLTSSPAAKTEAALLASSVLLAMTRQSQGTPSSPSAREHADRLLPLIRSIRENPAEAPTVSDMAAQTGYSPDHFTRIFESVAGASPKEFIIRARLERATQLLTESTLSIDQIARTLGYPDIFTFSRQFKKRMGRPPTAWRKTEPVA